MYSFGPYCAQDELSLFLGHGHSDLYGLVSKLEQVGRVPSPGMPNPFCGTDYSHAANAQTFNHGQKPFANRFVTMLPVLLRVKGKLIAVHFRLLLVGRGARVVHRFPGAGREVRDLRTGLSRPNRPEMRGSAYILGHRFGEQQSQGIDHNSVQGMRAGAIGRWKIAWEVPAQD